MMSRWCAGLLGIALGLTNAACQNLVEPNPDFIEPTGETCADDMLDCEAEPSCDKSCELYGQPVECVDGQCVGTVVFTGLADAYVDGEQPSVNFGFEPSLLIDQTRTSYIALPDIDGLPSGARLDHVSLHLTCTQAGTIALHRVESSFEEQQLTASNAPSGSAMLGNIDLVFGQNVIELTGKLPSWRSSSSNRSLRLSASGADPQPVAISSREGAADPSLVVSLSW